MSSNGLLVKALTKTYANGVQALRGVDLEVAGGMYGLLGPNGAGKSTLIRTLATLQNPDSGTFGMDGIDGLKNPSELRRRLGYLPQQIGSYPGVTGRSLLERFSWLKGTSGRKSRQHEAAYLLERVNLSDAADREVATYSGGMLRRFGIALALLGRPRLVIVDEPTAGLDPAERNRFHRVLAEFSDDAVVLLSTHIVEDVESLCGRLSILDRGKIVGEGTPEDLKAPLREKLWTTIIPRQGEIPVNALHLSAVPGGTRVVTFADSCPGDNYESHEACLEDSFHFSLGRPVADEEEAI